MSKFILVIFMLGNPEPVVIMDFNDGELCLERAQTVMERNKEFKAECKERIDIETV